MSNHSNLKSTSKNPPSLIEAGDGRYHLSEPASLDDVYTDALEDLVIPQNNHNDGLPPWDSVAQGWRLFLQTEKNN